MEKYQLDQDIRTMYVTATSFPDGVMSAYEKLHSVVADSPARKIFGISRPEGGSSIVYRAAVEQLKEDEAEKLGLGSFIIPKGTYISTLIPNFMEDVQQIGRTFNLLLQTPGLDPNGFCLEMYVGEKDVLCMIRLANGEGNGH